MGQPKTPYKRQLVFAPILPTETLPKTGSGLNFTVSLLFVYVDTDRLKLFKPPLKTITMMNHPI